MACSWSSVPSSETSNSRAESRCTDQNDAVERRDLLDLAGGLDDPTGRHHDQVPRDPIAARARRRDQLRLILGVEDHDVRALAAARSHRGDERVLDLLEPDGLQGLDPRVVRLLDRWEPRVRDDRAPPPGPVRSNRSSCARQKRRSGSRSATPLIFAAAAGRTVRVVLGLVRRRGCDRLAPPWSPAASTTMAR